MKAVNLIPVEARRGAGGGAGQSGGLVYVFLGALGGLLAMAVLYSLYDHQVSDRAKQLAAVSAQTSVVQAQAAQLSPYVQFASLSQQRTQSLVQLANGRFNWAKAMDQIARALPHGVTLNALSGGAASAAGGASAQPPASAAQAGAAPTGPTFSFTGCARSHSVVGTALTQLRLIPGVLNVSLSDSSKEGGGAPGGGAASAPGAGAQVAVTCPYVSFQGTVAFGTDAVVRVTPPNTSGAAAVQIAAPPGGTVPVGSAPAAPGGAPAAKTAAPAAAPTPGAPVGAPSTAAAPSGSPQTAVAAGSTSGAAKTGGAAR